jgi:5-formyltetrahydrofolate cyclo-ligase
VAFDKNCHRIGMGGGFYDATIEYFRKNYPKKIFIGLGYDLQNCEKIKAEKLDQSLDFIVSESILMPYKQ